MSIGLCCQYVVKDQKTLKNICNEKHLLLNKFNQNKYSNNDILNVWYNNIDSLYSVVKNYLIPHSIKVFRISSNLLPLFDKVPLSDDIVLKNKLKKFGDLIKSNNIRITSHPDQFCVLNSAKDSVVLNSIELLKYHNWVFDSMGLDRTPFYGINIHIGAGGRAEHFIKNVNLLGELKDRLTIENDELSYTIADLLEISKNTGVPVVLDTHHHSLKNNGISLNDALDMCIQTWNKIKPLTHLSNAIENFCNIDYINYMNGKIESFKPNVKNLRAHSDSVYVIPEKQRILNNSNIIDIDFEFKLKNIAIFDAINKFNIKL